LNKQTVLLIDDDNNSNNLLLADIHNYYEVEIAISKFECLVRLNDSAKKLPDVILLDLCWGEAKDPKIGIDILEEIRKKFSPFQLPVLIYTALAKDADALEALRGGAQDWLYKNSEPAEKIWRIEKNIGIQKSEKKKDKIISIIILIGILLSGMNIFKSQNILIQLSILLIWALNFGVLKTIKTNIKFSDLVSTEIQIDKKI